jgi:hypothetical protein
MRAAKATSAGSGYVAPSVRLEFGARSTGEPASPRNVVCDAAGLIEGVAAGAAIPCQIIDSAQWKRKAGVPADKSAARQMAARLWPGAAGQFSRVKDDGRAEAALLGRWYAVKLVKETGK